MLDSQSNVFFKLYLQYRGPRIIFGFRDRSSSGSMCSDMSAFSHHFMANRRGKLEAVTDFIFLGSRITMDGDCSHEIKRCLLLRRKAMSSLESVLKSRDITLPAKAHIVKATFFPVVMYGCES